MNAFAVIEAIRSAAANAKTLLDAARMLQNAELKQMIADLASQMADVSLEAASLKHEIIALREENDSLKAGKSQIERPAIKNGCYQFEGSEGLYCTVCWDVDRMKVLTCPIGNGQQCPACFTKLS